MDILLVDDNQDYLYLVKEALHLHGYTVHTAEDGMEGCEILNTTNIDLFISDIKMPKFDGIKLHAFAREIEKYKNTKFVFVSGYKDTYQGLLNLDPENDFFLDKATPPAEMVKFVDKLMFGSYAGVWV